MVKIQRIEQKKARKMYTCHLCGKPILSGRQYIYETYYSSGFHTLRRHIHCDAMLDVYNLEFNSEEFYHENEVAETLWENICKEICDEKQQDECSLSDLYACELCQKRLLHPSIIGAAIQSVKDNSDWDT